MLLLFDLSEVVAVNDITNHKYVVPVGNHSIVFKFWPQRGHMFVADRFVRTLRPQRGRILIFWLNFVQIFNIIFLTWKHWGGGTITYYVRRKSSVRWRKKGYAMTFNILERLRLLFNGIIKCCTIFTSLIKAYITIHSKVYNKPDREWI